MQDPKNRIIDSEELETLETRYRAAMINSLGGFKSVNLVGTISQLGHTNLAIFSSLFHLGANPALCGLIIRPDISPRHTLENILETGFYTINHINEQIYKKAHQTSARYPRESSEFSLTGLTQQFVSGINAPFVNESKVKFACKLVQKIDLELNNTILLIGKIVKIIVPESIIQPDGFLDIEKVGTVTASGLDSYHHTTRLARLSYAKPDKELSEIPVIE